MRKWQRVALTVALTAATAGGVAVGRVRGERETGIFFFFF